ncbi:hypothetical protein LXL04_027156 [Taraxacum kok-saghyz]
MRFLLTLFACCAIDEPGSKERDNKLGLLRERKLGGGGCCGGGGGGGGETDRKNGRLSVQWRPSLYTIYEDDVVKTKRIQVYVRNSAPSGYRNELVLQGSWDMVFPVTSSFLF